MVDNIQTISDTIIWEAKERQKSEDPCQNLTAAIHAIMMEVVGNLCEEMKNGQD